jgi:hypothetical protein
MSASKLPVVVELEDGYAVTFDDCVIAWRRDGDRYVVSISAVDGEEPLELVPLSVGANGTTAFSVWLMFTPPKFRIPW